MGFHCASAPTVRRKKVHGSISWQAAGWRESVDLSRVLAGPYTAMLADWRGRRQVERPGGMAMNCAPMARRI